MLEKDAREGYLSSGPSRPIRQLLRFQSGMSCSPRSLFLLRQRMGRRNVDHHCSKKVMPRMMTATVVKAMTVTPMIFQEVVEEEAASLLGGAVGDGMAERMEKDGMSAPGGSGAEVTDECGDVADTEVVDPDVDAGVLDRESEEGASEVEDVSVAVCTLDAEGDVDETAEGSGGLPRKPKGSNASARGCKCRERTAEKDPARRRRAEERIVAVPAL